MDLMQLKQDILIEGAEIVGYETLIEIIQKINGLPGDEILPTIKQSLQEEKDMHRWCKNYMPISVGILLPKILSAINN